MSFSRGFDDDYFEIYRYEPVRYGDHFDSKSMIDDTDHQLMASIYKVFSDKEESIKIESVLDVGCANGGKLQRLHDNYGFEVFGIENADWCRRNVIPGYESCIIFGDCRQHLHKFETNSYDFVLDCSSKYMPENHARLCVAEYFRIARKVVVSTISSTDQQPLPGEKPDAYQVIFRPLDWWLNLFRSADECKFAELNMFYLVAAVDSSI